MISLTASCSLAFAGLQQASPRSCRLTRPKVSKSVSLRWEFIKVASVTRMILLFNVYSVLKTLLSAITHADNAVVELRRRYKANFIRDH